MIHIYAGTQGIILAFSRMDRYEHHIFRQFGNEQSIVLDISPITQAFACQSSL